MSRPKTIETTDLLAAAREIFAEHGIAASTRQVARHAGISEAVIYQRFPTKSELFFEAMAPSSPAFDFLFTDLDTEVPQQLLAIARAMADYFREIQPIVLALATHPGFDYEDYARRHPDSPLTRVREGLMGYLSAQAARGTVNPANIRAVGLAFVATLNGLAFFERLGVHSGHFDAKILEEIIQALWQGLKPPN